MPVSISHFQQPMHVICATSKILLIFWLGNANDVCGLAGYIYTSIYPSTFSGWLADWANNTPIPCMPEGGRRRRRREEYPSFFIHSFPYNRIDAAWIPIAKKQVEWGSNIIVTVHIHHAVSSRDIVQKWMTNVWKIIICTFHQMPEFSWKKLKLTKLKSGLDLSFQSWG